MTFACSLPLPGWSSQKVSGAVTTKVSNGIKELNHFLVRLMVSLINEKVYNIFDVFIKINMSLGNVSFLY